MQEEKVIFCPVNKCRIDTKEGEIVNKKGAAIPQALRERFKKYLKELENKGIIRKSLSQWRNPIRVLGKLNGDIR
ncbi:hypothetical protein COBT_003931 [Conglomerata obtusa]